MGFKARFLSFADLGLSPNLPLFSRHLEESIMNTPDVRPVQRNSASYLVEMFGFINNPLDGFLHSKNKWGDIVPLPLPGIRAIQFFHPAHVGAILNLPRKDATTRSISDIMGDGLLTNNGPEWKKHRRLISPAFAPRVIEGFIDTMAGITHDWMDNTITPSADDLNMSAATLTLTLDILISTVFGSKIPVDRNIVAKALDEYMYEFYLDNSSWRRLLPKAILTPGRKRRHLAMRELEDIVYQAIARRKETEPDNDLLYRLIHAGDEKGEHLTDKQLRDHVLTAILAGHETTALMLSYSLWLLAHRPEFQHELRQELQEKLGGRHAKMDDMPALQRLDAVLNEAMRLYPPAYVVAREAESDMEIGGFAVKKGDQLLAPAWVIHRDPRWWQAPDEFRPERWLNGETASLPANAFFPFGGGPRLCVGSYFAKYEGMVVLSLILQQFEISPVPGYKLDLIPSITLRARQGIRLSLRNRH
jgi:cytochrome P450